jgi:uncharacterized membrane-anchored protein
MAPSPPTPWWSGPALRLAAVHLVVTAGLAAAQEASPARKAIDWLPGPATGKLGDLAEIKVPEGFRFADAAGARKFLELTQNPASGTELGVLLSPPDARQSFAFVIFQFEEVGYVKDDEKDSLDADKLLASIREGTRAANEERQKLGWPTVEVVGWQQTPFYDPQTHNLSWSIRGRGQDGEVINYSTRLLGRRGVMQADMVLPPEMLPTQLPVLRTTLAGFSFTEGQRYAEFRPGDKLARYGLTALIAGGAGALAAKSGLLAKLWKVLLAGALAVGALLKRLWARLTGKPEQESATTPPAYPPT